MAQGFKSLLQGFVASVASQTRTLLFGQSGSQLLAGR
jgi:hypothetical protein